MAILRATVTIASKSGIEVDDFKNVWHFETAGAVTDANEVTAAAGLVGFYRHLGDRFGAQVSRASAAHSVELAQVTQGAPGEDDDTVSKILGREVFDFVGMGGGAASLPSECAAALSFRGDVAGIPEETPGGLTRPASRRRGRIFLGPLTHGCLDMEANSNRVKLSDAFQLQVLDAYSVHALGPWSSGTGPVRHIVYSRASAATHPVVKIHVDDAVDIQRRRGEKTVARSVRDVVQAVI